MYVCVGLGHGPVGTSAPTGAGPVGTSAPTGPGPVGTSLPTGPGPVGTSAPTIYGPNQPINKSTNQQMVGGQTQNPTHKT